VKPCIQLSVATNPEPTDKELHHDDRAIKQARPRKTLMIRLLSIGVAATLTIAGMLAPVIRPAKAAEGVTLTHEKIDRVLKKSGATKVVSGQAKAGGGPKSGTSDGQYVIKKLPGHP
jgi:hypothetical protein